MIEPSWEVFDRCPTCGVGAGKKCINRQRSTWIKTVYCTLPHPKRRFIEEDHIHVSFKD